ncbi:putative chitinase 10 [Haematobia irritans]|uniref:putative chitinase 10 n=1 Tax=Haematobia irritans TaxID=7368 RepID=UPI003F50CA63
MGFYMKGFQVSLLIYLFLIIFCINNEALKLSDSKKARQAAICVNHAVGDFVENPLDCRLFYLCGDNGEVLEASCPSNMAFNSQTRLCDTIDNVPECKPVAVRPPQTSTSPPPSSNQINSIVANANRRCHDILGQESDSTALVFIANPTNCYQYFMCYHGQALVQECSANLYWNSKIGKCDLPSNVQCIPPHTDNAGEISTTTGDNPPKGVDSVCPLYGHHIFPHMERCDLFIYCVKGYAVLQQCPFFHHFDVESGRCQLRTRALCIKDLNLKFRKNTF